MQGAKGIFNSKRGVFALFVVACATVLAAIHIITGADWSGMVKFITGFLIAGHTASSMMDSYVAKKAQLVPVPAASS
jgi:hypothetical protein